MADDHNKEFEYNMENSFNILDESELQSTTSTSNKLDFREELDPLLGLYLLGLQLDRLLDKMNMELKMHMKIKLDLTTN